MKRAATIADVVKVFKPSPLHGADFEAFRVDTSEARGDDYASKLSAFIEINKDDPQKILFMGHRGSGKSTELWQVRKNLDEKFKVISFSIKEQIDATDLNYIDLIFSMLSVIFTEIQQESIDVSQTSLDKLYAYWNSTNLIEELKIEKASIEASAKVKLSFLSAITTSIKGVLSTGKETKITVRRHIEPKLSQLISSINDLIYDYSSALLKVGKIPLVVIEDLDKLDIPIAEDLFLNHRSILTDINIHIIYTFPIFLHYSDKFNEIKDSFDYAELLSMIKINNKNKSVCEPGRRLIKEIIAKRADISLFEDKAIDFVIEKSGGTLRNIFEMITKAALKIIISKDDQIITLDAVKTAYREIKTSYERCISKKHLETLVSLYNDKSKKPLADENLRELLNCMAIIEYNGERWCDLHPAVEDILRDKGEINVVTT